MADNATLEAMLKQVLTKSEEQAEAMRLQAIEVRQLRDAVVRLETHGYHEQIKDLRQEAQFLRDEIIVMKTKGQVFSAGVAAGISILISVISGVLLWSVKG